MNWYDVYLEDIKKKKYISNYISDKIKYKKPLIKLIKKYANANIIEAGTGTGVLSTYLASLKYNVIAIDIDEQMLELAKDIARQYNKNPKPNFAKKSIFKI